MMDKPRSSFSVKGTAAACCGCSYLQTPLIYQLQRPTTRSNWCRTLFSSSVTRVHSVTAFNKLSGARSYRSWCIVASATESRCRWMLITVVSFVPFGLGYAWFTVYPFHARVSGPPSSPTLGSKWNVSVLVLVSLSYRAIFVLENLVAKLSQSPRPRFPEGPFEHKRAGL